MNSHLAHEMQFPNSAAVECNAPIGDSGYDPEDALFESRQRWCSPKRSGTLDVPWHSITGPMIEAQALDTFLDRNLYFLPIPRYFAKSPSFHGHTEGSLTECLREAMRAHQLNTNSIAVEGERMTTTENCFLSLYPWIPLLYNNTLPLEHHVLMLCMMAFDPKMCRETAYEKHSFGKRGRETIAYFLQKDISGYSNIQLLEEVDSFLLREKTSQAYEFLPKSSNGWVSWADAKDMYFLPGESLACALKQIQEHAAQSGFSTSFLESHCSLMNVVDETLTLGYNPTALKMLLYHPSTRVP